MMIASGNEIQALHVTGKNYFSFDSNVAEPLKFATKEGKVHVYTCGEFILNFYEISADNIDDVNKYTSPAEVLDIMIHKLDGANNYVILSCKVLAP